MTGEANLSIQILDEKEVRCPHKLLGVSHESTMIFLVLIVSSRCSFNINLRSTHHQVLFYYNLVQTFLLSWGNRVIIIGLMGYALTWTIDEHAEKLDCLAAQFD